jgi:hypothetical protein
VTLTFQARRYITPFQVIAEKSRLVLLLGTIGLLLAGWILHPKAGFPTFAGTFRALFDLWSTMGLSRDLWKTLLVSWHANLIIFGMALFFGFLSRIELVRPSTLLVIVLRFIGIAGLYFFFVNIFHTSHMLKKK